MRWRLLLSPLLGGPDNMALDEALMGRACRTGETVLRVYGWRSPTLSLGRNQRAKGEYDIERLTAEGIDVVRRPTGGRALLHDREITYSVTAPVDAGESLSRAYDRINALLINALGRLGVSASPAAASTPSLAPSTIPCFAQPSAGELVSGGQKLVGSAQWRDHGALLQQGSILIDDDQRRIPALMRVPADVPPAPATLRALIGRSPGLACTAEALLLSVRDLADPGASALDLDESLLDDAGRLAPKYRDREWTWRR